jgi:hypothetical protein
VDKYRAPHSRLLIEPVTIPDLKHTGLRPGLLANSNPLFYANGQKNANMRNTVRNTMRRGLSTHSDLQRTVPVDATCTWNTSTGSVAPSRTVPLRYSAAAYLALLTLNFVFPRFAAKIVKV